MRRRVLHGLFSASSSLPTSDASRAALCSPPSSLCCVGSISSNSSSSTPTEPGSLKREASTACKPNASPHCHCPDGASTTAVSAHQETDALPSARGSSQLDQSTPGTNQLLVSSNTHQHQQHSPASTSSAFWWLQGGGQQQQYEQQKPQHLSVVADWSSSHSISHTPFTLSFLPWSHSPSSFRSLTSSLHSPHLIQQHHQQQLRGYKSNKKSMKPVYAKASRLAVKPLLPPISEEEREERLKYKRAPIIDTALPPIPVAPKPDLISRVGFITRGYSLDMQPKFAVVELAGTQFKVTVDDVIFINSLMGKARVNEVLSLGRVLLLGSSETTLIGRPHVPGAYVQAAVEEHFLDGKVHVFKFKRRNRYRKYAAPRPQLTTLRILSIHGLPAEDDEADKETATPASPGAAENDGLPIKFYSVPKVVPGGQQ